MRIPSASASAHGNRVQTRSHPTEEGFNSNIPNNNNHSVTLASQSIATIFGSDNQGKKFKKDDLGKICAQIDTIDIAAGDIGDIESKAALINKVAERLSRSLGIDTEGLKSATHQHTALERFVAQFGPHQLFHENKLYEFVQSYNAQPGEHDKNALLEKITTHFSSKENVAPSKNDHLSKADLALLVLAKVLDPNIHIEYTNNRLTLASIPVGEPVGVAAVLYPPPERAAVLYPPPKAEVFQAPPRDLNVIMEDAVMFFKALSNPGLHPESRKEAHDTLVNLRTEYYLKEKETFKNLPTPPKGPISKDDGAYEKWIQAFPALNGLVKPPAQTQPGPSSSPHEQRMPGESASAQETEAQQLERAIAASLQPEPATTEDEDLQQALAASLREAPPLSELKRLQEQYQSLRKCNGATDSTGEGWGIKPSDPH